MVKKDGVKTAAETIHRIHRMNMDTEINLCDVLTVIDALDKPYS
ncbi:MAG: hypothetical protein ACOX0U_03330 [Oscillospiraceae bacterium]|jgi:hypothetical protein